MRMGKKRGFISPLFGWERRKKTKKQNPWIPSNPPSSVGSDTGMTIKTANTFWSAMLFKGECFEDCFSD